MNSRFHLIATVLLLLVCPRAWAQPVNISCNFYSSPSGSGSTCSFGSPCSLTGAQTKAQGAANNAASRVVCMLSGTYTLGANWSFTSSDTNETWLPYSGQSKPGRTTAVIDGNSRTYFVVANAATGLSIYGLLFQNLISPPGCVATACNGGTIDLLGSNYTFRWNYETGCPVSCLATNGLANSTIDSNTFDSAQTGSIDAVDQGYGAIILTSNTNATTNNNVTHNLCTNEQGSCTLQEGSSNALSGNHYDYNLTITSLLGCWDCGTYYAFDESSSSASDTVSISYNAAYGWPAPGSGASTSPGSTHCIYLDAEISNATVTGNTCAQNNNTGNLPNSDLFAAHGGANNLITNNIFEVQNTSSYTDAFSNTASGSLWFFYQTFDASPAMTGNQIKNNIIFTSSSQSVNGAWPASGMDGCLAACGATPTFGGNDYYSTAGTAISAWVYASNGFTDSTTIQNVNPQFNNPSINDYAVKNPPVGWTTIPGGQGPVPYTFAPSATVIVASR